MSYKTRVATLGMNREEEDLVNELVRIEVLEKLEKHHFEQKLDIVTITCPDGTRIRHTLKLLLRMYAKCNRNGVNYHPLTHHGSGLILVPNSSLVKKNHTTDIDFLYQIKTAVCDIGYKSIALINHLPCKMARNNNIRAIEVVNALVKAKARIKEGVNGATVACLLQVASKDLYFMSKTRFNKWRKSASGKVFLENHSKKYSSSSK